MIKRLTQAVLAAASFALIAGAAVAQSTGEWRTVEPEFLWVIDTAHGRVLIELMPDVAPAHVERIRTLTAQGFYDGLRFHRVIRNFMAQTGDPDGTGLGSSDLADVPGEFTFRRGGERLFGAVEGLAGQGVFGFYGNLPVETQPDAQRMITADGRVNASGQFCPGVVGMARGGDPNSANSQFFFMTGQNPRLNGLYTPFGVILSGQEVVDAIKIGGGEDGQVTDPDVMIRARLASAIPDAERPTARVLSPRSPRFAQAVEAARTEKGARLSLCDIRLPVEVS